MGQQKWLILQLPQGFLQAVASNQAITKANASHNFWKLGFIDLSAECWQLLVLEIYRNTFNK